MTRALKKLIDYKNAAAMAISIINNKLNKECDGNMYAENYNKYHGKFTMASKILLILHAKQTFFWIYKI
jgi:hypothetical protein